MFGLEAIERLLSDVNSIETATTGRNAAAPSALIPSPTAPMTPGNISSKLPTAQSPIEGASLVAAPTSARVAEEISPVFTPASAPITKDLFPVSAPASAPTTDELSPIFAPASAPITKNLAPVSAPAAFPSRFTDPSFPTTSGGGKTQSTPSSSSMSQDIDSFVLNPFHIIVIACIVGVVTLLLFWKCCKSWKLKREKQMLRLQSTRVDAVLGDMQMVGMDEYDDDDPELI